MNIHHLKTLIALLLVCCCFVSCERDNSIDSEQAKKDIKNVLKLESNFFATQEFDKLLEFYLKSPETTIIADIPVSPGKTIYIRGYDAIEKVYKSFKTEVTDLAFSPPIKSDWNINVEGKMAWCTYIDGYRLDRLDNETYRIVILKMVGDEWKIVSSNSLLDMSKARLKIPISEFPSHLHVLLHHWQNEKHED